VKSASFKAALAAGALAIVELSVFFSNPGHFFQGDTLYWLANGHKSIGEFAYGFTKLDAGGWYRPLSQRLVESLLQPLFGLNPVPYRFVTFVLFLSCTILVFTLIRRLTGRLLPAAIGTVFFATHVTNAYTTYDVAFTPEILYTSFYILSVAAWFQYLQEGRSRSAVASLIFLVGGLLSKEAAVTIPIVLALLWLLLPAARNAYVLRWLAAHYAILAIYLVAVVGYLGVGGLDIRRFLESPGRTGLVGYELVIGDNILESLGTAWQWLFGLPAGVHGNWALPAPWMSRILLAFRGVMIAACAVSLWKGNWRLAVFGIAWFLVSVSPMLPLLDHFLPYYLMAPLVGMSIVVGVAAVDAFDLLSRYAPATTLAGGATLLAAYCTVSASTVWETQRLQGILGESSQLAANSVADLRAMNPKLPAGAILAFLDEDYPGVWWHHAQGGLFRMAYNDPDLKAQYSSSGFSIPDTAVASGQVRYFQIANGRVIPYAPYAVELPSPNVRAGNFATIKVAGLSGTELLVLHDMGGDPYSVRTNENGEAQIPVRAETPPGTYRILGVRKPEDPAWSLGNTTVVVSSRP
jgi:hypothetical protein